MTTGGKQDVDLLDFERSLRQLEMQVVGGATTAGAAQKRQSNTRDQEARSKTDVGFLPQPVEALATEQNLNN